MESKGKDPKAVGETDEDLVKVDTKFLLKATGEELLKYCLQGKWKDLKAVGKRDEDLVKVNAKYLLKATGEELVTYYLKSKILGNKFVSNLISEVDIYKYEPWELPRLKPFVSNEAGSPLFFFCPWVKNRVTEIGYWKKCGSSMTVMYEGSRAGRVKVLVYYSGKPPRGERTDWVMYEYRLDPTLLADHKGVDPRAFVLCRVFSKSKSNFQDLEYQHPRVGLGDHPVKAGDIQEADGSNLTASGGSSVQDNLKSETDSYSDFTLSLTDDERLWISESYSDFTLSLADDGFGVAAEEDSCVQNNMEIGSDSESDSSIAELMEMHQKPGTELMLNVSTFIQPKMYALGPSHLRFLSAPVAWEWLRVQAGDVIDSPEIKPLALQVVDKCRNSPLIISVVGSALTAETNPLQWCLAVQRLDSHRRGDRDGSLNPYIRYCYDRLKAHDVKTCFLYSALVLKNKQIHISALVKCFITQGLLGGMTMVAYKRANDIVGLLVKALLLEACNESYEAMMVNMHYMIRDSALAILSSSTEGRQMCLGRELGKLGAEQVDKYLIRISDHLKEPPPLEKWEKATLIFLIDNDFSTLPSNPYCPTLVSLFLQRNRYLRVIPASFFDSMHSLTNLNLSQTRIRSLPDSLFTLKSLQVLLLRYCEHLFILPSEIGQLTTLQVLDFQGTELSNLPDTINELASLKSLKVSFHGSINISEYNNLPRKLIGDGTISNLPLEELGMFVYPGDRRWTNSVSDITKEVTGLLLTTLYFHFPELESLEYFLQGSQSWNNGNLTDFNFIVGHDFKHALSLVTRDAELMHCSSKRCLRFVNGETIPQGVVEVLKRATSLYLDHHVNICSLSDFGIDNMDALKVCILSDCPVVQAIIDHAEDGQVILPSLEYLSLNSLWNLEAIISGHHFLAEESFQMLTFLSLRACPKLTYVFTLSMMKNLPKLEELVIEDCVSLEYIFCQEDMLGSDEFAVLPCLKVLKLYYLPNLCELGRLTWANVEYMHFYNCPKLKNLCMTTDDTGNIKEIAADKAWWDSLEWDEPLLSERLDKLFTQIHLDDL